MTLGDTNRPRRERETKNEDFGFHDLNSSLDTLAATGLSLGPLRTQRRRHRAPVQKVSESESVSGRSGLLSEGGGCAEEDEKMFSAQAAPDAGLRPLGSPSH